MNRRKFIKNTTQSTLGIVAATTLINCETATANQSEESSNSVTENTFPIAVCTWKFTEANAAAGAALAAGEPALDAIIKGVAVEEANLKNTTVGKGGAPDREGNVTLDACVMNPQGDYGAVLAVENITHVAALARKVMEETPHVILAGKGAEEFGYTQGFTKEKLLTDESAVAYQEWLEKSEYKPVINIENHDTIGMLAIDKDGDLAGACTTSGMAYKMKGRVGDSAIIGSGLFIDNEIGGAVATGVGEEVLKTVGSFLIVELMRNGMSPQAACEEAIARIIKKSPNYKDFQVAYIAINKKGETGAYCIHDGFTMMRYQDEKNENLAVDFYAKD
ncbi:MAG: isoaspartyl peptidase/L-asparaginase family protein [Saprospiraceae bacterium]